MIFPFPHASLAVSILRSVAPLDFPKSMPIYLLPESAMEEILEPVIRHLPMTTTAFTSPTLDQDLSGILSAAGCWQGSGVAVVYRDIFLKSLYGKDERRHFREGLNTLLHEAAHNLDFRSFTVCDRTQYNLRSQNEHHTERWARAFLHLFHRIPQAYSVSHDEFGNYYNLPTAEASRCALAEELEHRKHDSILKILADDPPRQFRDLMEG